MLSQIVAEELALPLRWVRLAQPESGTSPYDQATSSSRSTTLVGLALQAAARDLRQQLLALAAEQLQTSRSSVCAMAASRAWWSPVLCRDHCPALRSAWGRAHWPWGLSWGQGGATVWRHSGR